MPTDLEQSIVRTLCWFAVMKQSVTVFEVWKWMIEPGRRYALEEVYETCATSVYVADRTSVRHGHLFLNLEEKPVDRAERYVEAMRKYAQLMRAVRYLRLIGSVRAVAAVNSIAWWNTTSQSDIDLFIVTKPGTIWTTRLLTVMPFLMLGARPGAYGQQPLCFSFFADEHRLAMDDLRLPTGDHYFSFWLKSAVPILDRGEVFERLHAQNEWTQQHLPHACARVPHPALARRFAPVGVEVGGWAQEIAKRVQQWKFPSRVKMLMNQDSRVVVTDQMLKFHETDRREEFERAFESLVKMYV